MTDMTTVIALTNVLW